MRIVTYITDDDYARVADRVRDYETDKHTQGDGPDVEPVEVIAPKAWFADCADYVLPDTKAYHAIMYTNGSVVVA